MLEIKNNAGYEIIRRERVGNKEFLLGYNPKAPSQYVTWKNNYGDINPYWGHYFSDERSAIKNFNRRVKEERGMER